MKYYSNFQTVYYTCICFLFFNFFSGCHQQEAVYQRQLYVFGTFVEITFWGVAEDLAHQGANLVASDFQKQHHAWHAWQPSTLTALNHALATGQSYLVEDTELLWMLHKAKQWSEESGGLFNPAIGQLINLWGFQRDDLTVSHSPPSTQAITELLALNPTMSDLVIAGQQVSSRNPAVQLDLGAIAKGYALDLVIKRLQTLGIRHAIVNAGGNLKAVGRKGDTAWTIGIRHPSGQGVLAILETTGEESVITSGDYERFFEYAGTRYAHIIDSRTGKPARGLTSVTVIHPSGAFADAMATALVVAGTEKWSQVAQQMKLNTVMVVDEAGTVYLSPAMAERVQFVTDEPPKQVIVKWYTDN